jgi:hypothetical protein
MKSFSWKDVAELIAISAILVSLVFVGMQLNQAAVIANNELHSSMLNNRIEANNAISAHPDIWLRGNAGKELEPTEAVIFSGLVINENNLAYANVEISRKFAWDYLNLELTDFASYLYENPGAKRVWRDREERFKKYRAIGDPEHQFASDWIDAIESKLELFDRELDH